MGISIFGLVVWTFLSQNFDLGILRLGFWVYGLEFGIWNFEYDVFGLGLEFGVWGLEFWSLGYQISDIGFWSLEFGGSFA